MKRRATLSRPEVDRSSYAPVKARNSTVPTNSIQSGSAAALPPMEGEAALVSGIKKSTVNLADLLKLADQLPDQDRKELLDRLALQHGLESAPSASDRDLNMWAEAIHNALERTLGAGQGDGVGPLVIRRLVGARSAWAPVAEFMKTSKLADLTVIERQSVYGMLAGLLVDHARYVARSSGAPLGPKLVSSCAGSIRGIFDRSFPGYLAAGLAPIVARQLTRRPALA